MNKNEWKQNFSFVLQNLISDRGFTLGTLSKETNISKSSLCKYLRGENIPTISSVMALSQALKVEPYDLYDPVGLLIFDWRDEFFDMPISEREWISDFAFMLRAVLNREHCSQIELSRGTRISQGLISKYLNGTTVPSAYNFNLIVKYLAIDDCINELLDLGRIVLSR